MPIYEYKCDVCDRHFELFQKFSDEPLKACPECGGSVSKLISNSSFVLKGTGWYLTDYARADKNRPSDKSGKAGKDSAQGSSAQGGNGGNSPAGEKSGESSKAQ